jgi:predicted hotdog family 3-hydroxylacyl-ACP dehydratase
MTDEPPRPTSAAAGAHYHAIDQVTTKWAAYRTAAQALATHTAVERARKDREEAGRTTYGEAARKATEQGGS